MKRILMNTAALTLGLVIFGAAGAVKADHKGAISHSHHDSGGSGKYYPSTYDHRCGTGYHKGVTEPYYKGEHNHFWSSRYWSDQYGCYLHWCPRTRCWFYWCEPFECYYPIDYCPIGRYAY